MVRKEVAMMLAVLVGACNGRPASTGPVPQPDTQVLASGLILPPPTLVGLQTGSRTYVSSGDAGVLDVIEFRLERGGHGWILHTGTSNSTGRFEFDEQVGTVSYAEVWRNMAQGSAKAELQGGRITGAAQRPAAMGGSLEYAVEAPAGTVFSAMALEVVSVSPLAVGGTLTLPVFSTGTGRIDDWRFHVTGVETVTVPAGTFQAYRVEQHGLQVPHVIYLRQEAPHILLKRVNEVQRATWELQTVTAG